MSQRVWLLNLWEIYAVAEYEILEAESNLVEIQIHLLSFR